MARKYLTALDLTKNELQNAAVQSLASAPSSPVKFQLYGNSGDNTLYWWNGTSWVSAAGGGTGFPGYGSVPTETAFGQAKSDGAAITVARSDHTHGTPTHLAADHTTIPLSTFSVPTTDINMGLFKITNMAICTAATDAATKQYVDNISTGMSWKNPARVGTTANITLSGLQSIDGTSLGAGDRCLVKNQTDATTNGIYVVASGAWTRATDNDSGTEMLSASVYIMEGSTQADTGWVQTTNAPIGMGTSPLVWVQFSGSGSVGAGAGLTSSGTTLNVVAGDSTLTVAADSIVVNTTTLDARYAAVANGIKRFAAACAAATSTVVNHAFNTRDVLVDVYRTVSPWDSVECDIERTDVNNVTVRFTTAPAAGDYRIVVLA
jgi:hypothetical protein